MPRLRLVAPIVLVLACNHAPEGGAISLKPDAPTTADDLRLSWDAPWTDADGDPIATSIRWTVDGVDVPLLDDAEIVPATWTARGQVWRVRVTGTDGRHLTPSLDDAVTIANTPPVASVSIATVTSGAPITATATATDVDGDPISWAFSWTVDGEDAGVYGPTVPADRVSRGQVWRVSAVASDGTDHGAATASVRVGNATPIVTDVWLTPDTPTVEGPLTARIAGLDGDGDTLIPSFAWSVNDRPVPGAFEATLAPEHFSAGDTVRVHAVLSDGFAFSAPASRAVVVVNAQPRLAGAAITPSSPTVTDDLTCTGVGWEDPDGASPRWIAAWHVDGHKVGEGDVLPAGSFHKDDVVTCTLVPTDGAAEGAAVAASVQAINTPPVVHAVGFGNPFPVAGDAIVPAIVATDVDGDPITYTTTWYVDGRVAGTADTLTAGMKGDTVIVEVTPHDGQDHGDTVRSPRITVVNAAPRVSSVAIAPTPIRTDDTVVATPQVLELDGDIVTTTIRWLVDGADVGVTGPTLDGAWFDRGQTVQAVVVASDVASSSEPTMSAVHTVQNTPPAIGSATVTPSTLTEGVTATCVADGWFDADGDDASFGVTWYVDGVEAGTDDALTDDAFDRGDAVTCEIVPFDGHDIGTPVRSAPVVVGNAPPAVEAVGITPEAPRADDLIVTLPRGASDPDGDDVWFTTRWVVNGDVVDAGSVLTPGYATKGDTVWAVVTPTDGTSEGDAVTTAAVTIANTPPIAQEVTVTPAIAYADDTLTAAFTGTDIDGDDLDVTFTWTVDAAPVATGPALGPEWLDDGAIVQVEAWATDGEAASDVILSEPIVVRPAVPFDVGITEVDDTTLACTITRPWRDADGDPWPMWSFVLFRDGVAVDTAAGEDSSADFAVADALGDVFWCEAAPTGADAPPEARTSDPLVVGGSWDFDSCGAIGRFGPTACPYTGTPLEGDVLVDGPVQRWTVPVTGVYAITAWGARGGGEAGGAGALAGAWYALEAGDVLDIAVGQPGMRGDAGAHAAGGGGGATWVLADGAPILVAAGGGGQGSDGGATAPGGPGSGTIAPTVGGGTGSGPEAALGAGGSAGRDVAGDGAPTAGGGAGWLTGGEHGTGGSGGASWADGLVGAAYSHPDMGGADGGFGGGGAAADMPGAGGGGGGYTGGSGGNGLLGDAFGAGGGGGSYWADALPDTAIGETGVNPDGGAVTITLVGRD